MAKENEMDQKIEVKVGSQKHSPLATKQARNGKIPMTTGATTENTV